MNRSHILLPTEVERQRIFHWLKRISSVTAWRRILRLHQAWAAVVERSARLAEENGWSGETSLPRSEYAAIQQCVAQCENCVERLAKGDKSVFRFDRYREFTGAARMLSHWSTMQERIRIGENGINPHTPLWPEFCDAATALPQAWGECGPNLLETRDRGDGAPVPYGQWLRDELQAMWFPDELPPVPAPSDNILIWSGQHVPCSGIWEPVEGPEASILGLLLFRTPKVRPPFRVAGAMNYLHGGSGAPKLNVQTEDDSMDIDTTWRLLWRDDRYRDGTVPAEEAAYRFAKPDAVLPPPPVGFLPSRVPCAESGTAAPVGGEWRALSDLRVAVRVQEGEPLPPREGRGERWVLLADVKHQPLMTADAPSPPP